MILKGLNDLSKLMESTAKNVGGDVSFDRLFNEGFVSRESRYDTFQELFKANRITEEQLAKFDELDEKLIDSIIEKETRFTTWHEFSQSATQEYVVEEFAKKGIPLHKD